ncbi:hypothetical protein SLA2020_444970 [Shorea laevis]
MNSKQLEHQLGLVICIARSKGVKPFGLSFLANDGSTSSSPWQTGSVQQLQLCVERSQRKKFIDLVQNFSHPLHQRVQGVNISLLSNIPQIVIHS